MAARHAHRVLVRDARRAVRLPAQLLPAQGNPNPNPKPNPNANPSPSPNPNPNLLKAFEGAPSTVLLPLIQVASIWVLLGSSVIALFRGQRFMSPLHGLAYALMFVGGCLPATGGDVSRLLRRSFWKQRYVFYAIGSELTLGLHDLLLSDCSRDQHSEARASGVMGAGAGGEGEQSESFELPISPYISLYLLTSPNISPYLPTPRR